MERKKRSWQGYNSAGAPYLSSTSSLQTLWAVVFWLVARGGLITSSKLRRKSDNDNENKQQHEYKSRPLQNQS